MVRRTPVVKPLLAAPERSPLGTRAEVAKYLGVPISTLAFWAMKGIGPTYVKVGRSARYRWSDVDAWVEGNERGDNAHAS